MWWTGGLPFWPHWSAAALRSPPLTSTWFGVHCAVMVIHASPDDRCAHIVSSMRRWQPKVTARLGFNRRVFHEKAKLSPRVPIDPVRSQEVVSPQTNFKVYIHLRLGDGLFSVPGRYQPRMQSSTRGHFWVTAQCTALHLPGYFLSPLIKKDVADVFRRWNLAVALVTLLLHSKILM